MDDENVHHLNIILSEWFWAIYTLIHRPFEVEIGGICGGGNEDVCT